MTRSLRIEPTANHPVALAADVMHRAFQNYVGGEMNITPALFAALCAAVDVVPGLSRIAFAGEDPIALALIARRGWRSRLAAMGVVPDHKGRGVGRELLEYVMDEARGRGEQLMELECFEQNERGLRLYRSMGFHTRRRLYGYTGTIQPAAAELRAIDPIELSQAVAVHGLDELPWQVSALSLAKSGHPQVAYALGRARVLLSSNGEHAQLAAIVTEREARRRGDARALLRAVAAKHGATTWHVGQLSPEELDGFFERIGFARTTLNQVQMTAAL